MSDIRVSKIGEQEYRVEVHEAGDHTAHTVTVSPDELERYGGGADAETLLQESFRFLLEHEPKEAILSRFALSVIAQYFRDYPDEIRRRLGG